MGHTVTLHYRPVKIYSGRIIVFFASFDFESDSAQTHSELG